MLHERRDGPRGRSARTITDKKIAIGVVDHRNLQVERPEQVADLIRRALKHIPVERLIVSSDCGFGREGMSRRIAFYKMVSIVRGANIVRKELGLPEARASPPIPGSRWPRKPDAARHVFVTIVTCGLLPQVRRLARLHRVFSGPGCGWRLSSSR